MKKKQKNYNLILGIFIALFMLLFLLAGLFYTPYDPDAMNGAAKFAAPGTEHLFGCDPLRKGYIKPGDERNRNNFFCGSVHSRVGRRNRNSGGSFYRVFRRLGR